MKNNEVKSSGHRSKVTAILLSLLMVLAGCGANPEIDPGQNVGDCIEEPHWHLNQAGVMDYLTSWWLVNVERAVSEGSGGSSQPDGLARELDRVAFTEVVDRSENPNARFYLLNRDFDLVRQRGGQAIAGSRNFGDEFHTIDVFALVQADGSLQFVGNCAESFFTETFAEYVEELHPAATAEEVLVDMATSGDFSQYDAWLRGEETVAWADRDPRQRQVNPQEINIEDYPNLRETAVEWHIPQGWSDLEATVCTWTPMGWNLCVAFSAADGDPASPIVTEHFVVPGGVLELWLLDREGTFESSDSHRILTLSGSEISEMETLVITFHDAPESLDALIAAIRSGDNAFVTVATR